MFPSEEILPNPFSGNVQNAASPWKTGSAQMDALNQSQLLLHKITIKKVYTQSN
jgi:hypothetical protein